MAEGVNLFLSYNLKYTPVACTLSSPSFSSFPHNLPSIAVPRGVVLGTDDESASLARALVDRLDEVDELLLVVEHPVDLVVVSRPEVDHHVLVAVEEHDGARVVELIHPVKVGHLVEVDEVDDGKVPDPVGNLVERLVLAGAGLVVQPAEAEDDDPLLLGEDGLVDVPARLEVRQHITHRRSVSLFSLAFASFLCMPPACLSFIVPPARAMVDRSR